MLNHISIRTEELLAEQACFRLGRSTIKQICNCHILMEKHHDKQDLYHNFIDFKKASDRSWHKELWHVM